MTALPLPPYLTRRPVCALHFRSGAHRRRGWQMSIIARALDTMGASSTDRGEAAKSLRPLIHLSPFHSFSPAECVFFVEDFFSALLLSDRPPLHPSPSLPLSLVVKTLN